MLKKGEKLKTVKIGEDCIIEDFIGSGGQGEVYKVKVGNRMFALKWYFPEQATPIQREILENLIERGFNDERFLWPLDLVEEERASNTFGYVMKLRDKRFKSLTKFVTRKIKPGFRSLCTAGYNLADAFLNLHTSGYAYQDISFGNIFIDPDNGDILICDNDNVVVTGLEIGGVLGTPRFMAPEIVRGEERPDAETDRFSLAVLLFYMFFLGHPLEGEMEANIRSFDLPAMRWIYGEKPVFIFDPEDNSNRPVSGIHDNPITYWAIYPEFFNDFFVTAFTKGIKDENERIKEGEWRKAFIKLRDSIIYCQRCGVENFYDVEKLRKRQSITCWSCKTNITLPYRIKIGDEVIMLNYDTKLYPHHLDPNNHPYDFSQVWAEVAQHPKRKDVWGLKNDSDKKWVVTLPDGNIEEVVTGRSVSLKDRIKIDFETSKGELRYG